MRPVLMDVDPGVDDAVALVAALGCLDLRGVTTLAGNTSCIRTYHNARLILSKAGREDIPVEAGSDAPLFFPLFKAENVHGEDGLSGAGGDAKPLPPAIEPGWASLARRLAEDETTGLIATGPLTNVARMLIGMPQMAERMGPLVIMGGAQRDGNVTPTAEFNFYVDPHAADWVLAHGHGIRLVGLDVARKTRRNVDDFRRLAQMGMLGQFLWEIMCPYADSTSRQNTVPAVVLYDVLAVAAMDQPGLFEWLEEPLAVVHEGSLRGTMVEMKRQNNRPTVMVATAIDTDAFYEWFWLAISRAAQSFGAQEK